MNMKRKDFIKKAALISLFHFTGPYKLFEQNGSVNISKLELLSNNIASQKEFYKKLGFNIIAENNKSFTLKAGISYITFVQTDAVKDPFYHFAFNIARNKIDEAHSLMKAQVELLQRTPGEEIIYFPNFNSHSIFFEDSCRNIVEFIARHDLKEDQQTPFSVKDLINVSEIGLVTDDVIATANTLNPLLKVSSYNPAVETFCPIGDVDGLIIIVKKGRLWAVTKDRYGEKFPVKLSIKQKDKINYSVRDNSFLVTS